MKGRLPIPRETAAEYRERLARENNERFVEKISEYRRKKNEEKQKQKRSKS